MFAETASDTSGAAVNRNRVKSMLFVGVLAAASAILMSQYGGGYKITVTDYVTASNYTTLQEAARGTAVCPCAANVITVGRVAKMSLALRGWCDRSYTSDANALKTAYKEFCQTRPNYLGDYNHVLCDNSGKPTGLGYAGNVDTFCVYYHQASRRAACGFVNRLTARRGAGRCSVRPRCPGPGRPSSPTTCCRRSRCRPSSTGRCLHSRTSSPCNLVPASSWFICTSASYAR